MRQEDTPTQQGGQKTRVTSERAEASRRVQPETQGTRTGSHAVGDRSEDLCGKPEGLSYVATERVAEDTCETWDCTRRSVAGHVASRG